VKKENYGISELNPIVVKGNSSNALFGMIFGNAGLSAKEEVAKSVQEYFADVRCPGGAKVRYTMRPKTTGDVVHRAFSATAVMSASQRIFDLECECGLHKATVCVTEREDPKEAPAPIAIEGWQLVGVHGELFAREEQLRKAEEDRMARQKAEEARIADVKRTRRTAKKCIFCGGDLRLLDHWRSRESHRHCNKFTE